MDVWHSRAAVPTRRVALGEDLLLFDPPPGPGGLLLAAIVAFYGADLPADDRTALVDLTAQLERNQPVAQPRLRFRLQQDRVGLTSTTHRLMSTPDGGATVVLDRFARREPQLLAALYRASQAPEQARRALFTLLRSALRWRNDTAPDQVNLTDLLAYLTGRGPLGTSATGKNYGSTTGRIFNSATGTSDSADQRDWALEVLGLDAYDGDTRSLQRQFRRQMRRTHPDHGGDTADAGSRIAALTAARRVLLDAVVSDAAHSA